MKLVLASASPRRRQLMEQLGLCFDVVAPQVDESIPDDWPLDEAMQELSRRKARAVSLLRPECVIVSADTLVVLEGRALGKPKDSACAQRMLRRLSGRRHEVWTAMTVQNARRCDTILEKTQVWFRELTRQEIADYVRTGEPLDKAGAYGIQGRGAVLVEKICGDYYSVVGLPLSRLAVLLRRYEAN